MNSLVISLSARPSEARTAATDGPVSRRVTLTPANPSWLPHGGTFPALNKLGSVEGADVEEVIGVGEDSACIRSSATKPVVNVAVTATYSRERRTRRRTSSFVGIRQLLFGYCKACAIRWSQTL